MPITGFPHQERIYKKPSHKKNDSGELDVFEAAWYFAGTNEGIGELHGSNFSHKAMREERKVWGGRRMSLDMPIRNPLPSQAHQVEKQFKEKKYKQPSSPGGRLAKLLNSIFSHAASKKKKSKSTTQSVKDEESPGGRRKRRSSVSHFRSASTPDCKSLYLSSSSGFRTPPPYADTPTKVPLSKHINGQVRSPMGLKHELLDEKRNMDFAWLDEKFKIYNEFSEKSKNYGYSSLEKDRISETKNLGKFDEVDDGGESDSSSDLFELQNCDLGFYSSGLPVYETTHMESIKKGAPIANGTR
ncbi:protein BIG GRAIN 1-like E isoform X2 [Telopea speciosissima]|uniref:protein BIG GRAIN 1-like E isoform X2 n=1 Tax=Telopea speciosissima TaxID=54955 RepID=UPI001CC6D7D2|nr:protein BIG GRAIN 1-like E isoform X2 [Telopea speciosissima]